MILVSVGTLLPFDRLVRAADAWAARHAGEPVTAQIGGGSYEPRHMRWSRLLPPAVFESLVEECRLLVTHAGTGSFLLAAEKRRPIVLMPRRAKWREHTTDHQLHTARWLREMQGVHVAMDDAELPDAIAAALSGDAVRPVGPHAPAPFLARIREALLG